MSTQNSNILKVITLILAGAAMLSGSIWGIVVKVEEAKTYTDIKTEVLRQEEKRDLLSIQEDIGQLKQDTAVIRTIVEERLGRKR